VIGELRAGSPAACPTVAAPAGLVAAFAGAMAVSGLRGVRERELLTGVAFFCGFDCVRFLNLRFARTTSCSPTSADNSSVQDTRRPALRAGILMACFDTANVFRFPSRQFICRPFHSDSVKRDWREVTKPARDVRFREFHSSHPSAAPMGEARVPRDPEDPLDA
jgi:hypothetical protein